jgi:transposase-like protein
MKKLVAVLSVAGLLVAGGASIAAAAGPGQGGRGHGGIRVAGQTAAATIGVSPEELRSQIRSGKTVAQVATDHGVDPNTVVNAVVAALTQQIDQKAAAGTIDANRAAQAKQKLPNAASRFVNETKPRRDRRVLADAVQAAAKEIGVSTNDLKDARKNGKSIAQVAQDHGKSVDDVVNAVVKAATADVDQAVKDGKLDSQRADQIKKNLPDRAKTLVERQPRQGSASTPGTQ